MTSATRSSPTIQTSPVVITGGAVVCAAGAGLAPLVEALVDGQTLLADHEGELWPCGRVEAAWLRWPDGPDWADVRKYAGASSQLAVTATALALADAKLAPRDNEQPTRSATVVVVEPDQSAWESLATVLAIEDERPVGRRIYEELDDFHILRSIPTQISNFVARRAGFSGPQLAVARPCVGGLSGLAQALDLIRADEADRVLLCSADPRWSPYELAALDRIEPLATSLEAGPFDARRSGAFWGEGAAAILLEKRGLALERGARILASIDACETRCCAAGSAASAEAALEAVLAVEPRSLDVAWAHGTGSIEGDRIHATALEKFAPSVPVTSSHGAIGTLYASSVIIDLLLAAWFLHHQEVPPICLLDSPDPAFHELDLVVGSTRRLPRSETALVTASSLPRHTAGAAKLSREAAPR